MEQCRLFLKRLLPCLALQRMSLTSLQDLKPRALMPAILSVDLGLLEELLIAQLTGLFLLFVHVAGKMASLESAFILIAVLHLPQVLGHHRLREEH